MKTPIIIIGLLACLYGGTVSADCMTDQFGKVVCGEGQCRADQYGKVYCAGAGGGAMNDQYGHVQCGVGYCALDDENRVWCSKEPGGGAEADDNGNVKCLGGCERGSSSLCTEAQ